MENIYHVRLNHLTEIVVRWAASRKVELAFSAIFVIFYLVSGMRLHSQSTGVGSMDDSGFLTTVLLGWLSFVLQLPLSNRFMLVLFAISGWVIGIVVRRLWRKPSLRLPLIIVSVCVLFLNTATFCGAVLFLALLP